MFRWLVFLLLLLLSFSRSTYTHIVHTFWFGWQYTNTIPIPSQATHQQIIQQSNRATVCSIRIRPYRCSSFVVVIFGGVFVHSIFFHHHRCLRVPFWRKKKTTPVERLANPTTQSSTYNAWVSFHKILIPSRYIYVKWYTGLFMMAKFHFVSFENDTNPSLLVKM